MIDTSTKVILTVIAGPLVVQLAMRAVDGSAVGQIGQTCGHSGDPCFVTFSVLDKPCGESVARPCFVTPVPESVTGTTPKRPSSWGSFRVGRRLRPAPLVHPVLIGGA
jgi:hypothetical protein